MSSPQEREAALFRAAVELPPGVPRGAFLAQACAGDAVLRQRLEALLAAHEEPDQLLAAPAPAAKTTMKVEFTEAQPDEVVGQTLGRYKLLEKVGEGGCGVVYVAEQTEPVRRRVALKVIKLGMDTKAVVARFEAERQALAMMDHPNIAKVLDAGSTETGRPYFVMELVRGIKITDYCDQNNLPTQERLDLFIKVCQAIQHAHQKGIIHRDIKPSNMLVTLHDGVPVPKVIDFGIAKATEGRLTDATVYTQLHQFIGTPAYMSPEQAEMSGLDIDTRSDIYSLGVLLYELLTSRTPFDAQELMSQGIDAMRKTIREKDPMRPSTKLATLQGEELTTTAKRRSADRAKLLHQLKGDLDWIVMKCLEKDRTRRYETANGVAMDIKRHLNNEPVVARPPSTAYRFQKAFRRNKLAFSAIGAVTAALLLGIIASTWQAVRATHATRDALSARKQAEASEHKAVAAQANETRLREQAQAEEFAARQRAYASDMNVAKQAIDENNLGRALELLNRQRPKPGQKDLRGWEWRFLWSRARPDAHEVLFTGAEERSLGLSFAGDGRYLGRNSGRQLTVMDLVSRQTVFRQEADSGVAIAHRSPWVAFTVTNPTNSTLRVYDLQAQKDQFPPRAVTQAAFRQVFSPDDRVLVAVWASTEPRFQPNVRNVPGALRKLTAMDVATGETLWEQPITIFTGGNWVRRLDVSPDGTALAVSAAGGLVRVLDMRDGHERFSIKSAEEISMAVRFSPDGATLVTSAGYGEPVIRIWDAREGRELGHLEGHETYVTGLVFTPDGRKLISSSADYTIRVWDWAGRRCVGMLRGHLDEVEGIALAPDGRTLASNCKDGTVYLWDLSKASDHRGYRTFATSASSVARRPQASFEFLSDNRSLLELPVWGQPQLWDLASLRASDFGAARDTNRPAFAWSPDGTQMVRPVTPLIPSQAIPLPRTVSVLDVRSGRELTNLQVQLPDSRAPRLGVFDYSADGKTFVRFAGFQPGETNRMPTQDTLLVQTWSTTTWQTQRQFEVRLGVPFIPARAIGRAGGLGAPDLFAFVGKDVINVVDISRPDPVARGFELTGNAFNLHGFAVSPDRAYAATISEGGFVWIWDWKTRELEHQYKPFRQSGFSVGFSPDGRRFGAGGTSRDEAVKIWGTDSWEELITLEGEGSVFGSLKFSPDGRHIFAVNTLGLAHLWTAPTMQEIAAAEAKEKIEAKQP